MSKSASTNFLKCNRNSIEGLRNGIVEASGSTPLCSTIILKAISPNVFEIPNDFEVAPAVRWTDNAPYFYRVLIKKSEKRCE